MSTGLRVSVIGKGAVGGALVDLFYENSITVCSVWSSESGKLMNEEGELPIPGRSVPLDSRESGTLIFITVPDDQIPNVVSQLADSSIDWSDKSAVHCSGAWFSDALQPLADKGARVASMHPVQTFRRGDGASRFQDIFISLEGDARLVNDLQQIVQLAGANSLEVDKRQKRAIHLSAVMASNYLVTLQYVAQEFLADNHIPDGFKLVEPLVKQTLDNLITEGVTNSLSGPVERGDLETVEMHLKLLQDNPDLLHLYSLLGSKTTELAEKGSGSEPGPSTRGEIKELFKRALKKM